MAWVNALTTTHALTGNHGDVILGTWATVYGMPDLVTQAGYECVASTYMYLNHVDGAVGSITNYWRDIAPGVKNRSLMLGGEVSMVCRSLLFILRNATRARKRHILTSLLW